jgi:hypothetical protein
MIDQFSPHIPFNLQTELDSLPSLSIPVLRDKILGLEKDRLVLDSQLTGYEEGIDLRTPLWYQQAKYVYKGKGLLIEAIGREIRRKNEQTQAGRFISLLRDMKVFTKHATYGESIEVQAVFQGQTVLFIFKEGKLDSIHVPA